MLKMLSPTAIQCQLLLLFIIRAFWSNTIYNIDVWVVDKPLLKVWPFCEQRSNESLFLNTTNTICHQIIWTPQRYPTQLNRIWWMSNEHAVFLINLPGCISSVKSSFKLLKPCRWNTQLMLTVIQIVWNCSWTEL